MKLAHFVVPHIGGTYSVHRALRVGLSPLGIIVRWIGLGPGAAAVLRNQRWAQEHAHGEAVALVAGNDRLAARELVEHLERERYDGVIIGALCGRLETNIVRYLPEWLLRLLIVHTTTPGTYAAARAVRDHVHATVGVSPRVGSDLIRRHGFDASRTHVVPNAVDLESFMRLDRRQESGVLRVIFLGRLEDQSKGIFWLPQIVSMLGDLDVRLTVAGDGPDRGRLQALCMSLGDRVGFLGRVSPEHVPEILINHDILLMPSRYEGFGCTLVEAMAAGCVPVASRIKGVTDAVVADGITGLLFPIGDVKAAAEAVRRLARDRFLLKRRSASCRESAARFSSGAMAASYAAILASISNTPPAIVQPLSIQDWRYPAGLKPGLRAYLPIEIKNTLRFWRERLV